MKLLLCLSALLASSAWAADEAADRSAIEKVISTLSRSPDSPGLFTDDFGDNAVLISLGVYRNRPIDTIPVTVPDGGRPTIHLDAIHMCVSHEPWGELEPCGTGNWPAGTAVSSHFVIQSIRLLTPDVALVDAVSREFAGLSRTPVLMVLHKEGGVWKIASLRVVAQPRPPVVQ
jgi:hypothetical protein